MSKKYSLIAVTTILVLALLSPSFFILAYPGHTYHEDPATATEDIDLVSILVFYSNVFDLAAGRHYQDADATLNEIRHARIPDYLRYLLDRYNTLSRQLFTLQNRVESLLFEASTLISENRIEDARQKLTEAESDIRSAQFLLRDIETLTNSLGERLGVFSVSARSGRPREAFDRLQAILGRPKQLTDRLDELVQQLLENPQPVITSFYYQTFLEVSAPSSAYPGVAFTISGQVSSTGAAINRIITVVLDDTRLAEVITPDSFRVEITPPPPTATGVHVLTVMATAWKHYARASWSAPINILRMPITIEVEVPAINIIPWAVPVSGNVNHHLEPVPDAEVTLALKESSTTVTTAADGSFATRIAMLFDPSLFGPQQLTVTVAPAKPWYAPARADIWIFTINLASIGLMLIASIAFISLVMPVVRRGIPRPRQRRKGLSPAMLAEPPPVAVTPAATPRYERPSSAKGKILAAYDTSLMAVTKATAMTLAPQTTLREFAAAVTPLIPMALHPFTELTTMVEITLYSTHQLDEQTQARAELLAGIIIKELHGTA